MAVRAARQSSGQSGLAALGIAVAAVVCCAALPLLAALAGGVAIGTVLGVGGGTLAAVVLVGAIVVRTRRSSTANSPPCRAESGPPTDAPGERSG